MEGDARLIPGDAKHHLSIFCRPTICGVLQLQPLEIPKNPKESLVHSPQHPPK